MSRVYISKKANEIIKAYLLQRGHEIIEIGATGAVYPAVETHPDIYMCKLGAEPDDKVFKGDIEELGFEYPYDVKFNAACIGDFFIHNLKFTSEKLLKAADCFQGVNIKQGYTKCNLVVVDNNSAITSDAGIFKALRQIDEIDILKVRTGYVKLEGFEYGFLGGASGRVGSEILFNGNLEKHPDFAQIRDFIEARGLSLKYFKEYELEDIGSIIEEPAAGCDKNASKAKA
ncbi:MAG: hypothetical protein K6F52_06725 [Clostridia bacterium]|nr:hypothetical protein [Clostridia bacterium]